MKVQSCGRLVWGIVRSSVGELGGKGVWELEGNESKGGRILGPVWKKLKQYREVKRRK